MENIDYKAAYLKQIGQEDWEEMYFSELDKKERKALLEAKRDADDRPEYFELLEKLFVARYVPVGKEPAIIDHFMTGLFYLKYLPEGLKGRVSPEKKQKKVKQILDNFSYDLIQPYGELGHEIWYKELCNLAAVYINICRSDRHYGSVILGFGKMSKEKLAGKIGLDVFDLAIEIPEKTGTVDEFREISRALTEKFCEEYPSLKDSYISRAVSLKKSMETERNKKKKGSK